MCVLPPWRVLTPVPADSIPVPTLAELQTHWHSSLKEKSGGPVFSMAGQAHLTCVDCNSASHLNLVKDHQSNKPTNIFERNGETFPTFRNFDIEVTGTLGSSDICGLIPVCPFQALQRSRDATNEEGWNI